MRNKTKVLDRSMTLDPERENPGPGSYYKPKTDTRVSKYADIAYGISRDRRFSNPGIFLLIFSQWSPRSRKIPKLGTNFRNGQIYEFQTCRRHSSQICKNLSSNFPRLN